MRWRASIAPRPTVPRLDRERAALARLATATDDAALAEWARLRLRASDFVAANTTPTPAAIATAAARDAAEVPLDLTMPPPLSHASGATLVDVTAKLPTLDRLAAMNAPRHEAQADARRAVEEAREAIGTDYCRADAAPSTARVDELAWVVLIRATLLLTLVGTAIVVCVNPTWVRFGSVFPIALVSMLLLIVFGPAWFGRFLRWPYWIKLTCVRIGLFLHR